MCGISGVVITIILLQGPLGSGQGNSKAKEQVDDSCTNAMTQSEMNRCAAERFRKADLRLNALYQQILGSLQAQLDEAKATEDKEQVKYAETGLGNLKEAEKAWILYRDLHCAASTQREGGGSIMPLRYANCMEELTAHRILELRNAYGYELRGQSQNR